jgi:hypothetical protein
VQHLQLLGQQVLQELALLVQLVLKVLLDLKVLKVFRDLLVQLDKEFQLVELMGRY